MFNPSPVIVNSIAWEYDLALLKSFHSLLNCKRAFLWNW